MDIFTVILWIITAAAFILSMIKDKDKTINSMKMAKGMMKSMIGEILGILFLIGLILTFMPHETINRFMGKSNILVATLVSAAVGAVTLIPAFVAFPLVGSIVKAGVNLVPAVAFLTTLTMVGAVTFPLEKQEFGLKFTVIRNTLSFGFAIIIALAMGVLM